jgi:hypothetical protein
MSDPTPPSPVTDPPEETPETRREKKINCEFCECHLSRDGAVLHMSDKAKMYREIENDKRVLGEKLAAAQSRVTELEARVAELSAKPKHKSILG